MKVNIPSALPKRNKFVGSSEIHSTRQFFEFCPDYYRHLIPNQEIDLNITSFARSLPLPVPTMGKLDLCYRAFFIPYSSVWKPWHDFKANTQHATANLSHVQLMSQVVQFYEDDFLSILVSHSTQTTSRYFDFSIHVGGNSTYYVIDPDYRYIYKIFLSLGYRLRGYDQATSANPHGPYNALPLLSLLRVFVDYYWPSQFRDSAQFNFLLTILNDDRPYVNGVRYLSVQELAAIFQAFATTCYDDNIFINSFVNPVNPNTPFNQIVLFDPTFQLSNPATTATVRSNIGASSVVQDSPSAILEQSGQSNKPSYISQFLLNGLQRLTQYMKRNSLAGSFAYERMLARFGIQISNDYSKYIDSYIVPINIGDVMSNTDNYVPASGSTPASGAELGSYAGKAMGFNPQGDGHFHFTAPDFGMFLVVASIVPRVGYFQGVDRFNLCVTPTQFFEPEFDGLSPQAITPAEIYTPHDAGSFHPSNPNGIFGYAPSNYFLKIFNDNVIGDYTLGSINEGMDAYYLKRVFDDRDFGNGYADIYQSIDFVRAKDFRQYLRMFGINNDPQNQIDPFRVRTIYNIETYANMRSLYDDIDFDQLQHDSVGESSFDLNGAKLN